MKPIRTAWFPRRSTDGDHRVIETNDPRNGDTVTTYDAAGNVLSTATGRISTTYTYDSLNRVSTVSDGIGTTDFHYDADGNVTSKVDAAGHTTFYSYNERNQVVTMTDAAGGVTSYGYDAQGNLTTVTDQINQATTYVFDGANRMRTETAPTGTRTYLYDAAGNLVSIVDRDGRNTTYEYDNANRVVLESWLDSGGAAVHEVTSTYDLDGRLIELEDGATATLVFGHPSEPDATNRLASETVTVNGGFSTTVTYVTDVLGRALTTSLATGGGPALVTNTYGYDALTGRLASILQGGSFATAKSVFFTYQPDIDALATAVLMAGGSRVVTTNYVADNRGLFQSITYTLASGGNPQQLCAQLQQQRTPDHQRFEPRHDHLLLRFAERAHRGPLHGPDDAGRGLHLRRGGQHAHFTAHQRLHGRHQQPGHRRRAVRLLVRQRGQPHPAHR